MRIRVVIEPQDGASYETQLRLARAAEDLGFDGFFRSDHYLRMADVSGLPGPTDAWLTLAGLARDTDRIRLGTLMTAATFRFPGPLAVGVAQVDAMSGGRVEFGLGAGWYEDEHRAYGIPFPGVAERFERLAEQLAIITGLWATPDGATFDFTGRYYSLSGSPALPKPAQRPRPPIIIGGYGPRRTPRLAVRYADEFNLPYGSLADTAAAFDRVRAACQSAGRAVDSIALSASQHVLCGTDDAALARRATDLGFAVDRLRTTGLFGSPAAVAEKLRRFAALGADRVYLQPIPLDDLDHLAFVAAEVVRQVGSVQGGVAS
jgi:F420-dependent oxidoreductase-like protein